MTAFDIYAEVIDDQDQTAAGIIGIDGTATVSRAVTFIARRDARLRIGATVRRRFDNADFGVIVSIEPVENNRYMRCVASRQAVLVVN